MNRHLWETIKLPTYKYAKRESQKERIKGKGQKKKSEETVGNNFSNLM